MKFVVTAALCAFSSLAFVLFRWKSRPAYDTGLESTSPVHFALHSVQSSIAEGTGQPRETVSTVLSMVILIDFCWSVL